MHSNLKSRILRFGQHLAALLCEAIAAVFFVGTFCGLVTYDWVTAMFAASACALFGICGYVIER
jgi:hypothetical protein